MVLQNGMEKGDAIPAKAGSSQPSSESWGA